MAPTARDGGGETGLRALTSKIWRHVLRVLILPVTLYGWLTCKCRPDVVTSKTREQEWRALRSEWRWAHAIFVYLGPPSCILWNIKWPLLLNMLVAGAVMGDAVSSFELVNTSKLNEAVTLTWRLSSFMLSLLMAFKVNRVYDRWWMGRQAFAGVGNASLMLAQMAVAWVKNEQLLDEIIRWCKVWHFSIYGFLMREKTLHPSAAGLLDADEYEYYRKSRKGRNLVVTRIRQLVSYAGLGPSELLQMDQAINKGVADQGSCSRIMFQCMPYSLTLMCSGFLEIWLLLMPFGLFSNIQYPVVTEDRRNPAFELLLYLLVCILMLGVDEVASQLEQPFPHMPLLDIADTTMRDIGRVKEEAKMMALFGNRRLARGDTAEGLEPPAAGPLQVDGKSPSNIAADAVVVRCEP